MSRQSRKERLGSLGITQRSATSMRLLNTLKSVASKDDTAELKKIQRSIPADLGSRASLAFKDFTGFKAEEHIEYLDQVMKIGNAWDSIYSTLDYMLRQPHIDYGNASRELTRDINKFHRQLAILRDGPYLPRIASRTFQDLEDAFRNREIPIPEDGNEDEVNLLHRYHDMGLGLIQELQEYGIKPLQGLADFLQAIQELANFDSHAPERLIDKFRYREQESANILENDTESSPDFSEDGNGIERARYFKSVSQYAQETLDNHFPSYLALSKAGIFPFIVDNTNSKSEEEAINGLLESLWHLAAKKGEEFNLETLVDKDKELGEIRSIIHATPNERRKEIYSLLLEHPEYIEFAQDAKRINVTLRDYARFVLDYARTAVIAGEETTAFGFINRLANNPLQREVAKILLESDTDWTPAAEQIYALAQAAPDAIPLIKLYLKSYNNISPEEHGKIREALARLPDEVTKSLAGGGMWSLDKLSMFTLPPEPTGNSIQKKPSTPPPKTTGYGIDEIARMNGIDSKLVRDAYEYLQVLEMEGAWQNVDGSIPQSVWQDVDVSRPEGVNRLARYIIAEIDAKSPHLPKVLGHPELRRDYFSLFDGRPEPLDKLLEGLDPNNKLYNNLAHKRFTARR